jgi:hypothetical protein
MRRIILLALAGCNDYGFSGDKPVDEPTTETTEPTEPPPRTTPDVRVTPSSVDLGVVCDSALQLVEIHNDGDGPLTVIALSLSDPSFTLGSAPVLPSTVDPGSLMVVEVFGTAGDAVLRIETDDPDTPSVEVPLTAASDAPPLVTIDSPTGGTVLGIGEINTFYATVSDDADPTEALSIGWTSDVDGALGGAPADPTGVATLTWDGNARSSGPHVVTLTVQDSCEHRVDVAVPVCQNAGYTAESLDLKTWNFEGSARYDSSNGWIELTGPYTNQAGTAFQTVSTVDSTSIEIAFSFFVSGGSGADGISLTALDSTRMTSFVGSTGGGIGYAGLPGWSVEIDTWYNAEQNDPTPDDHVSVHIDGDANTVRAWSALPEMEDNRWHTMEVVVVGTHMTVAIDSVVYVDQDVPSLPSFPAYVGFTAATGAATNYHLIDALIVEGFVCE